MTNPRKRKKQNTRYLVQLSMLFAIQIVLVASPLGFVPIGPIDITLMHIPALIGAITMGPMAGSILGAAFGVSSLITATLRSGSPSSFFFSPFISGSWWSVVISIVPRILLGLIAGWLFRWLQKSKLSVRISAGITAGASSLLHSILVMGGIYVFFADHYAQLMGIPQGGLLVAMAIITTQNGLVEAAIAIVICAALAPSLLLLQNQPEYQSS